MYFFRNYFVSFLNMLYEMSENLTKEGEEPKLPYGKILERSINKAALKKWEVDIFLENLKKELKIFEPASGFYEVMNG